MPEQWSKFKLLFFVSNSCMPRKCIKTYLTATVIQNRQKYAKLMEILFPYSTMTIRNLEDLMLSLKK